MRTFPMGAGCSFTLRDDGTVTVTRDYGNTGEAFPLGRAGYVLAFAKAVIAQSREAERAKLVAALAETSTVFLAANSARNAAAKALDEFDGKRRA